ncbi:MAG: hypothetical protein R3B96_16385 [Pirellulaceae bacterium]
MAWGLQGESVALFRDHTLFLAPSGNPYSTPAVYADTPVSAGYVSSENRDRFGGAAAAVVVHRGAGRIVAIAEQPIYRGFFDGSARIFDNAVLLGPAMKSP